MASSSNQDEFEFDQSFFSNLVDNIVESDTNDISIQAQMEDGIPNTRERPGMGIKELRYKRKAEVAVGRDPCPDTRDWSKAKRLRVDQKGTVVRNDMLPFDVMANKKSAALATWLPSLGLAEVTQMRGNFWRTTGYHLLYLLYSRVYCFQGLTYGYKPLNQAHDRTISSDSSYRILY